MRRRTVLALIGAAGGLLLAAVIAMSVFAAITMATVRQTQLDGQARAVETRDNTRTLKTLAQDNKRLLQIVEDCTTPGGVCQKRSVAQTAAAVGGINTYTKQVATYAAFCARAVEVVSVPAIESCIEAELDRAERARTD